MARLWRQGRSTLDAARANFFWDPRSRQTVPLALSRWAAERPDDPFLWFEGKRWTVGAFAEAVNRHSRAWSRAGIRRGQVVALMLGNSPAYLVHFYALLQMGAVAALINPALRGESLAHALRSSEARALLVDTEARPVADALAPEQRIPTYDLEAGPHPFSPLTEGLSGEAVPHVEHLRLADLAAYVFTSGTTGLPKPALVKHHRLWRAAQVFGGLVQLTQDDVLYCCLPLYHANAIAIATPTVITHRATLALARKFSARRFWRDCVESEATAFIYVGELLRYLINQAPRPEERQHQVERILGNGLAADLWGPIKERFGIPRIAEYYAATEGNAETLNLFNREASVGPLLPWKMAVVEWDAEAEDIVRDDRGRGRRVGPGTPGLLLGKIDARNEYAGYADPKASQRKVLRDVFRSGDAWFNSGDLVAYDPLLHLRFVDRIGDTFRWKSENVSTREVAETLTTAPGVLEACVYGVQIPGHEGRAGMAALVVSEDFDPDRLAEHAAARLPRYAVPRFVRLVDSLEVTGTFKHRKQDLVRQGYAEHGADPLFIWAPNDALYRVTSASELGAEQLARL